MGINSGGIFLRVRIRWEMVCAVHGVVVRGMFMGSSIGGVVAYRCAPPSALGC